VVLLKQAGTPADKPKRCFEDGVDAANRQGHFEALFETEDPWNYGSLYEQQKYQRQLDILPEGPIGKALELACAEGHFTVQLAPRVEHLLATDIAAKALARTRKRCAPHRNIDYQLLDFSAEPLPGGMDVILCSEVLYYLSSEAELRRIALKIAAALQPGGCLVTAHAYLLKDNLSRTGFDWDIVYGAEVIHRVFTETPGLILERTIDSELYRIDRFRRITPNEPAAPPVIETMPVVDALDRNVARFVVWGGAKLLRNDAAKTERRAYVPVLMYHGASGDGPASDRVSPAMFKAQLRWLRANGYYGIGSAQLAEQMASGAPFRGRPVMLSFDDGFQDFTDHAWPALVAHDFTAEMFVVTGQMGQTAFPDQQRGPPAKLPDAATVAQLTAEGVFFGVHLSTHRPIGGLSDHELAQELAGSRAMVERWLGEPPASFAVAFGTADNRLSALATQIGYKIGFGGGQGVARLDADPLNLPRIVVQGEWTLDAFIHRMESWL
jgi:peptidoglycan/xylan/chitin deacetylase (PgdA/CDA1 family)/SAM-dependent methyltransferase